jgi:hypothetical protein
MFNSIPDSVSENNAPPLSFNSIFLIVHFFTLLVTIAQQPGQAGVLGRLYLSLAKTNPKDCHKKPQN